MNKQKNKPKHKQQTSRTDVKKLADVLDIEFKKIVFQTWIETYQEEPIV